MQKKVSKEVELAFRKKTAGIGQFVKPVVFNGVDEDANYLLVHTTIIVPFKWNLAFFLDTGKVKAQLHQMMPAECVGEALAVRPLSGIWETITVWKSIQGMKEYYLKGDHAKVMFKWNKYTKVGENILTWKYKISGKELNFDGYSKTKEMFLMIKDGGLESWE
eukprot:NODE_108_length_19701_cov_0.369452.p8 type:complete len:163 gc:universal NODE_108_length_19701_cov_0.369452:1885-2373(+)